MKQSSLIAFILIASLTVFSFTTSQADHWKEYKSTNGITVFEKTTKCSIENGDNNYIVFKYMNNNNYDVKVSYKLNLWIGENCRSCDLPSPNEYEISITVPAGQTVEYSCTDDNKGLKLFKPVYNDKYKNKMSFNFENFKIEKL